MFVIYRKTTGQIVGFHADYGAAADAFFKLNANRYGLSFEPKFAGRYASIEVVA